MWWNVRLYRVNHWYDGKTWRVVYKPNGYVFVWTNTLFKAIKFYIKAVGIVIRTPKEG